MRFEQPLALLPNRLKEHMNLRDALKEIDEHGFGHNVDADAIIRRAAEDLVAAYDNLGLKDISPYSAADQCATFYDLLSNVGMPVL